MEGGATSLLLRLLLIVSSCLEGVSTKQLSRCPIECWGLTGPPGGVFGHTARPLRPASRQLTRGRHRILGRVAPPSSPASPPGGIASLDKFSVNYPEQWPGNILKESLQRGLGDVIGDATLVTIKGAKGEAGEPGDEAGGGITVLTLENVSALEVVDLEQGSLVFTRKSGELWLRTPDGWKQVLLGRQL